MWLGIYIYVYYIRKVMVLSMYIYFYIGDMYVLYIFNVFLLFFCVLIKKVNFCVGDILYFFLDYLYCCVK